MSCVNTVIDWRSFFITDESKFDDQNLSVMDVRNVSNKDVLKQLSGQTRQKEVKAAKPPRKPNKTESRMQIVDDDIGLPSAVDTERQEDFYADAEEAPTVVGVVDENVANFARGFSKWQQIKEESEPPSPPSRSRTEDVRPGSRKRDSSDSDLSPERPTNSVRETEASPRRKIIKREESPLGKTLSEIYRSSSTPLLKPQSAGLITNVADFSLSKRRMENVSRANAVPRNSNAETVYRDRDTGRKTDRAKQRAEEAAEQSRKAEERQKLIEKYAQLGRGVRQTENHERSRADIVHEMSKPLARTRDDKDLDRMQREALHLNDPMLQFQPPKETRRSRFDNAESSAVVNVRPVYKGAWPSNRFNLVPGHRWDGVDRSNGFEQKFFKAQANKRATDDMAYKWSTEDM